MSDDDVGYGKPPKRTQFKSGFSGNPRGRPKRVTAPLEELIGAFLEGQINDREGGRLKTVTRAELALRTLVDRAVAGDIKAAENVVRARAQARRGGGPGALTIQVDNWLPDAAGQTARQKTQAHAQSAPVSRQRPCPDGPTGDEQ